MRLAFDEIGLPADNMNFDGPFLRQKGMNRVLFYPGTFNPPHKGHRDLLMHTFTNAGDDLHIAAGIILPTDDERLALKMSSQKHILHLTKHQRAALLRGAAFPAETFFIFDHSEENWRKFRAALMSVFQEARLEVKLVILGGPDWIKMEGAHDPAH
jgi:nicotinic acid mononucleotide adenylyltransferase